MPIRLLSCAALAVLAASACAPEVGDECETALDCSSQGSRLCDRTQPHGYCTIRGCESGTCPEEAVCVKFRPREERLAFTYCMLKCDADDDCRNDEGYVCTSAGEFGEPDAMEAEILGRSSQRFCSVPALANASEMPAASTPDAGGDAASP